MTEEKMSKVAVVTGSANGLGRALALFLASEGFVVAVHYRNSRKEALDVLAKVKKKSPESIVVCGDLTDEKTVEKIFSEIQRKLGRLDLLVNNVGDFIYKAFAKVTNAQFRDIVETNVYATCFCSKAVLPIMRKQKSGYIINIGTVGVDSLTVREKSTPYFMAKNAIYFLTKAMAWEEAANGIHVNMISPASLVEDIFDADQFPMGRSAKYEDVAKVLKFLISPAAYYINGANIEVAGAFIPGLAQGK